MRLNSDKLYEMLSQFISDHEKEIKTVTWKRAMIALLSHMKNDVPDQKIVELMRKVNSLYRQ